jgi:hypothetical protein
MMTKIKNKLHDMFFRWLNSLAVYMMMGGWRFTAYDKRGVRAFVTYSEGTGKWGVVCWRKKTKEESQGETDWKMVREGHIVSYYTRKQATVEALKKAQEICEAYKF